MYFKQLTTCDIPKCGYSSWVKAYYTLEGKWDVYLDLKSKKGQNPTWTAKNLFRMRTIKNETLRREKFDNSLKVKKKFF